MADLKSFIASYKSTGHKFVPYVTDDNNLSELDSTRVLQINLCAIQLLLKSNSLVFLCELACNQSWIQFVESYLLCRRKPAFKSTSSTDDTLVRNLDQLVFLVYLRLSAASEVDNISNLIPRTPINASPVITSKRAGDGKQPREDVDSPDKVTEQYRKVLSTMQFLRVPCVMDVISILGDNNQALSARLVCGLCSLRPAFAKETADALSETVKALIRVHQSVIILSRRLLDNNKTRSILGKAKVDTKISNLSVVSLQRSTSSQDKASKLSAAEELAFLSEFAADILLSVSTFLSALSEGGLLVATSALFCLGGTRLTGKLGQPFVLALRNVYEVAVPLLSKCVKSVPYVDNQEVQKQLGVMQLKALSILEALLRTTHRATDELLHSQHKTFEELFDSMDVLREDGIEWIALLQGHDPLGKDPLMLSATSGNAGDAGSDKVINAASGTAKGTTGGVLHTVDETEVVRGAYVSDFMKIFGPREIETAVQNSSAGDGGSEQVAYIVQSLHSEESLLRNRVSAEHKASQDMSIVTPTLAARAHSSGKGAPTTPSNSEAVSNIKAIFPDLGEGFIEACIAAYKGNMEELIDALLTDNLQPSLLVLDRSLQKMWIGKGGGSAQGSISLDAQRRDAGVVYKAVEDASFKQLQLERIKKMEAQQEYDHMLLTREYNDDYDDQYDELDAVDMLRAQPVGASGGGPDHHLAQQNTRSIPQEVLAAKRTGGSAAATVAPEILNRRERRKNKGAAVPASGVISGEGVAAAVVKPTPAAAPLSKAAILQQMAEMKRFNSLTRDAEAEAAYWDGMRNTNKHSTAHAGKNSWKAELAKEDEDQQSVPRPPVPQVGATASVKSTPQPPGTGPKQDSRGPQKGAEGTKNVDKTPGPGNVNKTINVAGPKAAAKARPKDGGDAKKKDHDSSAHSVDGSEASGDSKKHRTKPYDKHHQKDRATRKFSHFAPSS